jgi:hypothetical protein
VRREHNSTVRINGARRHAGSTGSRLFLVYGYGSDIAEGLKKLKSDFFPV